MPGSGRVARTSSVGTSVGVGCQPRNTRVYAPSDSRVSSSTAVSNRSPASTASRAGRASSQGSASRSAVMW
ncbi:hypothetical protein ABZ876_14500 [Streptomyces sp. NPDC046931]|uniref:hypothetical protein n=1 Tax=Streptomyces sp. NPDC046931 TaxID=3154806 RepID=UPI0033C47338